MSYDSDARRDAADTVLEFADQIAEQLVEKREASDDLLNDYPNGDAYHHESHVDRSYDVLEAATVLDELDEHEEDDSGLWEGLGMKEALSACAAYTYGRAVYHHWTNIIADVNMDEDIDDLLLILDDLEDMKGSSDEEGFDLTKGIKEMMEEYYGGETTVEAARQSIQAKVKTLVQKVAEGYTG